MLCQLVDIRYFTRYLLFYSLFVINRSFILFIVRLFACFISSVLIIVVQKKKELFWPWTVFRYFDPVKKITPSSRVNKHHTADSTNFVLVQEAKEPITIIDKRDRRNQYSPTINLSRGRDINYHVKFKKDFYETSYISRYSLSTVHISIRASLAFFASLPVQTILLYSTPLS
jgi:hypothetical protein